MFNAQITSCVDPLALFPKGATGRGWMKLFQARANIIAVLLQTLMTSPLTQPPLKVVEVRLQVSDQHAGLAGPGYDCRVVLVESYLDVLRGWEHVLEIHT